MVLILGYEGELLESDNHMHNFFKKCHVASGLADGPNIKGPWRPNFKWLSVTATFAQGPQIFLPSSVLT